MTRIKLTELRSGRTNSPSRDMPTRLPRPRTNAGTRPDVTLINLNLMLVNADGTFDQQAYLPLGLLYIAACLQREGCNVEFVDYQVFSHAKLFDAALFVGAMGDCAAVVGISCMSNLLPFAILVAERLKETHHGCKVVLGGVGPSPVAEEIVRAFPFIDSVVEGEGELTMLDFVRGPIPSLPSKKIVNDLDSLPLPAYNLIDFSLYDAAPSIITSRGCPFKCTFCTEPYNFSGSVRFRSVPTILEEIELVHARSGRTLFLFQDDILPLKPSRFRRLLEGLRGLSFPIQWKCFSRVDLMSEDLMREMAASGCVQIRYGIESGSNATLERIRKEFTIELALEVATRSIRHFPSVHASFIWGYPFELAQEFDETLRAVTRLEEAAVTVLLFEYAPLPGSPLYRQTAAEGLRFSKERYSFYVVTGAERCQPGRYLTNERFESMYDLIRRYPRIFSGFYQYESADLLRKRERLREFELTRRSALKNECDL